MVYELWSRKEGCVVWKHILWEKPTGMPYVICVRVCGHCISAYNMCVLDEWNVQECFIDLTLSVTHLRYHHICIYGKTGSDDVRVWCMYKLKDIPTCINISRLYKVVFILSVNRRSYSVKLCAPPDEGCRVEMCVFWHQTLIWIGLPTYTMKYAYVATHVCICYTLYCVKWKGVVLWMMLHESIHELGTLGC